MNSGEFHSPATQQKFQLFFDKIIMWLDALQNFIAASLPSTPFQTLATIFQRKTHRLIILVYLFGWIIGKSSGWKIRWRIPMQAIISSTIRLILSSDIFQRKHSESIDCVDITQITHNWMVINGIYIHTTGKITRQDCDPVY